MSPHPTAAASTASESTLRGPAGGAKRAAATARWRVVAHRVTDPRLPGRRAADRALVDLVLRRVSR